MAAESGKLGVVKIGAAVVAATQGWTLRETVARVDASIQGSGRTTNIVGLASAEGTINALLDEADATGQLALVPGATVALELYPEGEGTGNPKRAFNAIVESVDETIGNTDANQRVFSYWSNEAPDRTAAT